MKSLIIAALGLVFSPSFCLETQAQINKPSFSKKLTQPKVTPVFAGADQSLVWPENHLTLTGHTEARAPMWTQVSGPAPARFHTPGAQQSEVAFSEVGTYHFRFQAQLSDKKKAADDVVVKVLPNPRVLNEQSKAADHLALSVAPVVRRGNRLLHLNRHDFSISTDFARELGQRWGYNLLFGVDTDWGEIQLSQEKDSAISRLLELYQSNPQQLRVTLVFGHVLSSHMEKIPVDWPATAVLCDAEGKPLDFDAGPETKYKLSPEAPDSVFVAAGQRIGQAIKSQFLRRGVKVDALANQGEYGIGIYGFDGGDYEKDPVVKAAAYANGSWPRYLSGQTARQERLIKTAIYASSGLSDQKVSYFAYTASYNGHRGRWGAWDQWAIYLEDYAPFTPYPGPEFYLTGNNWEGKDGGGTPQGMTWQALNQASGQKRLGRPLMVPWCSAGGWAVPAPPEYTVSRDRYTGFLKMMFTLGSVGAFQDDYSNDLRIIRGQPIGDKPTPWVWGLEDMSRVYSLFTYLDDFLFEGELLDGPAIHPYQEGTPAQPLCAFPVKDDPQAWVVARKLKNANRWLICAFAATGKDRLVNVEIPVLGRISLEARGAGSVYVAERKGTKVVQKRVDEDAMNPTQLFFADEKPFSQRMLGAK